MIKCAFHIGQAVQNTKLGYRISLLLISLLGHSILGLGYAIQITELMLGPFIPSNTARGGSIVMPIVMSLIDTCNLNGDQVLGKYMVLVASHSNLLVSSFYITGAASNPIVTSVMKNILGINIGFYEWTIGALLPFAICFVLIPFVFCRYYEPEYNGALIRLEARTRYNRLR